MADSTDSKNTSFTKGESIGCLAVVLVIIAAIAFFSRGLWMPAIERSQAKGSVQYQLREYSDDGYIWIRDADGIWGCFDKDQKFLFDIGEGEYPLDFRKGVAFVQNNDPDIDIYGGDYFVKADGSKTMLTELLPPSDEVTYSLYDVGSELFVVKLIKPVPNNSGVKEDHAYWGVFDSSNLKWHMEPNNPINTSGRGYNGDVIDIPINKKQDNQNKHIVPLDNGYFYLGMLNRDGNPYNFSNDNVLFVKDSLADDVPLIIDSYQQYSNNFSEGICYVAKHRSDWNGMFSSGFDYIKESYFKLRDNEKIELKDFGVVINNPKFLGGYALIVFQPDANNYAKIDYKAKTLIQIIDKNGKAQLSSPVPVQGNFQTCEYGELSFASLGEGLFVYNNAIYDLSGKVVINLPKKVENAAVGRFKFGVARVQNYKEAGLSTKFIKEGSCYIDDKGNIVSFTKPGGSK